MMTPIEEAQYRVIPDFPGGAAKLAQLAGMNAGTLMNKVNPGQASHKLSVAEAITVQYIAQDFRILHTEAAALRHVCVLLGDYSNVSDTELLDIYARMHKEIGDLAHEISKALEDRQIDRREFRSICVEMDDSVRAMYELRARLEGLARG